MTMGMKTSRIHSFRQRRIEGIGGSGRSTRWKLGMQKVGGNKWRREKDDEDGGGHPARISVARVIL